jgi:hypothetical protein
MYSSFFFIYVWEKVKIKNLAKYLQQNMNKRSSTSTVYRPQENLYLVRKEVLCNVLIQFGIHMKLVTLTNSVGVKLKAE